MALLIPRDSAPTLGRVHDCLKGSLHTNVELLHRAVQGFFAEYHRKLLRMLRATIESLEKRVRLLDEPIAQLMGDHSELIERVEEITGVKTVDVPAILSYESAFESMRFRPLGLTPSN